MRFEWDEKKLEENFSKHGLDFADAWKVFNHTRLTKFDDREDYGEDRWVSIGLLDTRIVVVVFTDREDENGEVIRIISLRKARNHERTEYEQTIQNRLGAR